MRSMMGAATAAALALGVSVTVPAHADTTATVKERTQRVNGPNLKSGQDGAYNVSQTPTQVCHSTGEPAKGFFNFNIPNGGWDNLWYKTSDGHYVADVDIETYTLNTLGPDCGSGGGSLAPAASSGDKAGQALVWARNQIATNPDSTVQCEAFVEEAYNHAFRYESAIAAFNDLKTNGQIHTNSDDIPAGALVFTSDPPFNNGFERVMHSQGNGQYLTANYYTAPCIREVPNNSNHPSDKFLGWAYAP